MGKVIGLTKAVIAERKKAEAEKAKSAKAENANKKAEVSTKVVILNKKADKIKLRVIFDF